MTKQEVANRYKEHAIKMAELISQISEIKESCEYLTTQCLANMDPEMDIDEMLIKGARALSSLVIYWHEIQQEVDQETKGA